MLNVQRRHRAPCKKSEWDAGYAKCVCPLVIRGTLQGKQITLSTRNYLPPDEARSLEAARNLALLWEREGCVTRPANTTTLAPVDAPAKAALPTLEMAAAAFLADATDRGLSDGTVSKKRTVFEKHLLAFAKTKGLRFVAELSLATVREWRASWTVNSLTRSKRQKSVIGFLWFCERAGWLPTNHATTITKGLGKIEVRATETGYFEPGEYGRILDAAALYSDRPGVNHTGFARDPGQRIRTVTELMRWTGLRIRDAVTLEKNRLSLDPATGMWSVLLYQRKTGEPVYCPIPPHVAALLRSVPASQKGNANDTWFFWTGHGLAKTLVSNWERSFARLFRLADLRQPNGEPKRAFPHMFRDTFAVESLLAGVPLVEVSKLLGHSSIQVTEKHYMPWVRSRQLSLNQTVMASWARQGIVVAPAGPGRPSHRVIPISAAV